MFTKSSLLTLCTRLTASIGKTVFLFAVVFHINIASAQVSTDVCYDKLLSIYTTHQAMYSPKMSDEAKVALMQRYMAASRPLANDPDCSAYPDAKAWILQFFEDLPDVRFVKSVLEPAFGPDISRASWRKIAGRPEPQKPTRVPSSAQVLPQKQNTIPSNDKDQSPDVAMESGLSDANDCIRVQRIPKKPGESFYNSEANFEVRNSCNYEVVVHVHGETKSGFPMVPAWNGPRFWNPEWPAGKLVPQLPFSATYSSPDWSTPVLSPNSTNRVRFSGANTGSGQLEVQYRYFACRLTVNSNKGLAKQRMFHATDGSNALCFRILAE